MTAASAVRVHQHIEVPSDPQLQYPSLYMQLTQLQDTVHLWIGQEDGRMGDLATSLQFAPQTASQAPASQLLPGTTNFSEQFAKRMATKYPGTLFLCSCSLDNVLPSGGDLLQLYAERKASEFIKRVLG
ncbi:hypothetical protein RI367_005683 [Sorochytrium milnesiophthora]